MSTEEASLGLATTRELIAELAARAEVASTIGEMWPGYSTVGGYAIEEQAKPAIEEPLRFASVVRVKSGALFVRVGALQALPWASGEALREWDQLDVDEVLRVGVDEPLAGWEKELLGVQERRDIEADAYKVGERTGAAILAGQIHHRLQKLLTEAITSERKNAYEKALQVVEGLQP